MAVSIAAASQLFVVRGQSGPRLYTTWSQPGGSIEGAQYSALKQINKTNVRQLELQWFHPAPGPTGRFAFSPLVVDNVMYVVGKDSAVFALDAATGKELWSFATEGTPTNRGFNYWESADRSDRRIIFASRSYLQQLDARTGKPITSFGVNGLVNLREGLGRAPCQLEARSRVHRGTCSATFLCSDLRRAKATTRRPAISARSTCSPAGSSGRFTRSLGLVSSATTPGRRMRGRRQAARTHGPSSPSTRSAASATFRSGRRHSICGEAIARGITCSATRCSRSTCARASGSGTISCSTTICGTTIL